jgi:hypothetical protein
VRTLERGELEGDPSGRLRAGRVET